MSISSPGFYLFLLAAVVVFAAAPPRLRPAWLLLASLWFYAALGLFALACLAGATAVGLAAGAWAVRAGDGRARRWRAGAGIVALIAALVVLKFGTAVTGGWFTLSSPAGFSFYVFTLVAHLADLARGERGAEAPPLHLALHVAWFPKIIAGPIERSGPVTRQIAEGLRLRPGLALVGVAFLLSGLVKKVVIADNLAPVVDAAYAIPAYAAPLELLIASYFFAFQIYCDFSGYSDMAIGMSALFGLTLSRNFDRPYLSQSIGEFWGARWHITLARWFRDYVYIPLGGSRAGRLRQMGNLLAVFALSGLWHAGLGYGVGWGFLVWGLWNGVFVVAENLSGLRPSRHPAWAVLRGLLVFHIVCIGWVFFRAASPVDALTILRRIATALPEIPAILPAYPFTAAHVTGAALIVALMAAEAASGAVPLARRAAGWRLPARWGAGLAGIALLLVLGRWQGEGFIYAQF